MATGTEENTETEAGRLLLFSPSKSNSVSNSDFEALAQQPSVSKSSSGQSSGINLRNLQLHGKHQVDQKSQSNILEFLDRISTQETCELDWTFAKNCICKQFAFSHSRKSLHERFFLPSYVQSSLLDRKQLAGHSNETFGDCKKRSY